MQRWLIKTHPEGKEWLADSKAEADPFCRAWVTANPGAELILFFRHSNQSDGPDKGMRPTTRYSSVDGQVVAEKLHRRSPAAKPSQRVARGVAQLIDILLQNQVGLTAREATRARQALVEIWKEGLQAQGLVWTPAGSLFVAKVRRIKRARNASRAELIKLLLRKIKIKLRPDPKYFPEPTKNAYTYKQYGIAKQRGLIEDNPRPKPPSPLARAMRPTSNKPKRTPPPRRRRGIR